jgi:hypothetical protein
MEAREREELLTERVPAIEARGYDTGVVMGCAHPASWIFMRRHKVSCSLLCTGPVPWLVLIRGTIP